MNAEATARLYEISRTFQKQGKLLTEDVPTSNETGFLQVLSDAAVISLGDIGANFVPDEGLLSTAGNYIEAIGAVAAGDDAVLEQGLRLALQHSFSRCALQRIEAFLAQLEGVDEDAKSAALQSAYDRFSDHVRMNMPKKG